MEYQTRVVNIYNVQNCSYCDCDFISVSHLELLFNFVVYLHVCRLSIICFIHGLKGFCLKYSIHVHFRVEMLNV